MRVAAAAVRHVISGLDRRDAGTTTFLVRLVQELDSLGHPVVIDTIGHSVPIHRTAVRVNQFKGNLSYIPSLRSLGWSTAMGTALASEPISGVLHAHGLWSMSTVIACRAARARSCPIVLSPHGMLGAEALQFSKWKKRLFDSILQASAVASVDCWHACSEKEVEDIRSWGVRAPVALVPIGVDLPPCVELEKHARESIVLFLGRLHPKKGVDTLLSAWRLVAPQFPNWRLRVAGPLDDAHGRRLMDSARAEGMEAVELVGARYGNEKLTELARARLFVLPTRDENFGIAVAEALAAGLPVVCTNAAPWRGLEDHACGWWIELGEKNLVDALRAAMGTTPERLEAMGANGRHWMKNEYQWASTGERMGQLYNWLAGAAPEPDFIRRA